MQKGKFLGVDAPLLLVMMILGSREQTVLHLLARLSVPEPDVDLQFV
jgi:hypothetical protein